MLEIIKNARTINQIVNAINDDVNDYGGTSEQIAAEYAYEAAEESGYEIDERALDAHLDFLIESGAEFDKTTALENAVSMIDDE